MKHAHKLPALALAALMLFTSCARDVGNGADGTGTGVPDSMDTMPETAFSETGHLLGVYSDDGDTYTFGTSVTALPESWDPHAETGSDEESILSYTTDTLYKFEYNSDFTGAVLVPSMAESYPVDVTADYAGQYGVESAETGRAYKITLRDSLRYDNGEAITADDFVESFRLILSEGVRNGEMSDIVGADEYAAGGGEVFESFISEDFGADEYIMPDALDVIDGVLCRDGCPVVVNINDGGRWSVQSLYEYNEMRRFDGATADDTAASDAYARLADAADADGIVYLTPELAADMQLCIARLNGFDSVEARYEAVGGYAYTEFEEMAYVIVDRPAVTYERNVGFFAPSERELVVVFEEPLTDEFTLLHRLNTNFGLVYLPLYERDGENYATSVETYVGFGPYALTVYAAGSRVMLERNAYWHGYGEGEYIDGTYMADRVEMTVLPDDEHRLRSFLSGQMDEVELSPSDARVYIGGGYTVYTESAATWIMAMNPDAECLAEAEKNARPATEGNEVNKTALTVREFRLALSYATDRVGFVRTVSPTSTYALGIFSDAVVADTSLGVPYRDTEYGADAISEIWGDAEAASAGYDIDAARECFDKAYEIMCDDGLLSKEAVDSGDWEVQIVVGKPTNNEYWTRGLEFLSDCWLDAAVGTPFEGKLVIKESRALGEIAFSDALRDGRVDMLFSVGYGGDGYEYDPYSLLGCYTGDIAYDAFTDKKTIEVTVTLGEREVTASLYDWSQLLCGGDTDADISVDVSRGSVRSAILSACEAAILREARIIPLMTDAKTSLRGERIMYGTDKAVTGMGHGGIEWMKFTMDDDDFSDYIDERGGELEYR